ncbi:hypothetical protein GYMLUDRAFT_849204 [Collybiopsis luxurians FD-317 M1]|nr:hypothetical protein GYMLUDRAFT_849204 [Collybiopsis luxurians FD-317 M1]
MVQMWTYIILNRDKWFFRAMVCLLFVMDMATTYFDISLLHFYLVSNFGDLNVFASFETFFILEILLTALIVFVVDLYFASRVYLFKQVHWSVLGFILSTDVIALLISLLSVVISFQPALFAKLGFTEKHNEIVVATENAVSTVCEVVATAALAWSLGLSQTGVRRTDLSAVLRRLLTYTITRGLLLTVIQVLSLVVYVAQPTKLTWVAFHMCLSKLYFITMVAMLNTRTSLRKQLDRTITDSEVGRIVRLSGLSVVRGTSSVPSQDAATSSIASPPDWRLTQISIPRISEDAVG